MTAGTTPGHTRPNPDRRSETSRTYFEHSSAPRINTDLVIVEALRAEYPNLHLTVVPVARCDILAYCSAGNGGVAPIDNEKDRLAWRMYVPPASRLSGKGVLADSVKIGKYLVDWRKKEFVVHVVEGRDGGSAYPVVVNQYVLSASIEATNALLIEAGQYGNLLHDEVWVFDGGAWQKNKELWDSVQKSHWEDVILDPKKKSTIRDDVELFFDSRETYERLKVPWKRGIIYYGPPGNGKTISIKAMMNDLYNKRKEAVPTLYVRTLASFAGPEYSLSRIFALARQTAPCLLVFEDLDSIVSDRVRSYFLNEVDGIRKNDGILIIGSTNHLERLDPGIVKRPSRFDRKYLFNNPIEDERTAYMRYWQKKLSDNPDIEFPDEICPAVAKITDGFSFAYLQEAMVASLLAIARDQQDDADCKDADSICDADDGTCPECLEPSKRSEVCWSCWDAYTLMRRVNGENGQDLKDMMRRHKEPDSDLDDYVLWREIKKQVKILREEMGDEKSHAK